MDYIKTSEKNALNVGTWNVQGLKDKEKKIEIFMEIERQNVDIAVLTETKLEGSGQEETLNYKHFFNGVETGHSKSGVSILIKKSIGRVDRFSGNFFNVSCPNWKNERIIAAKLIINEMVIIIIGVYWLNECADKETKEQFQQEFRHVLKEFEGNELIILGDFNSKVGISTENKVVGNFGNKEINYNGRILIKICEDFRLKIQNTFFDHKDIHKYTRYGINRNGKETKSIIDFFITRQETTLHVHDVLACSWFERRTDHIFLGATISLSSSKTSESNENVVEDVLEMRKYKTYLLYSKSFRDSFNKYLDSVIYMPNERSTQEKYDHLKESIHSAAYDVLGIQDKNMLGEFFWDKEIKDLRAKIGLPHRTTFDSHFGKIQNEVWEGFCLAIENIKKNKRSNATLNVLNEMLNMSNENETNQNAYEIYKSLCSENIKGFKVPKVCCKIDPDKTLQINVTDVTKALYELEDDNKWPVPGGLSIQLLRNSSDKTKSLLTDLIQDIFMGKEMPPEIRETYYPSLVTHCIMRVMCFILKEKLENETLEHPSVTQLSHLDAAFTMRLFIQGKAEEKCHLAFINLKEMYLHVDYTKLFEILDRRCQLSAELLAILEQLIRFNSLIFVDGDKFREKHVISKGLLEQCSLGPALFKLYIQETRDDSSPPILISDYKLIIFSTDCQYLETVVENLRIQLKNILDLYLIGNILEYLGNGKLIIDRSNRNFELEGKNLINFDGSFLKLDGSSTEEVVSRINQTKLFLVYLHPVLRDKIISTVNKIRIFNTIIKSILMDCCETWTLTHELEKSINLLENYYWKLCTPCNTLLANLKLEKVAYDIELKKMSEDKLPVLELKNLENLKNSSGKAEKWTDDRDEIKKNEIKYKEKIQGFKLFYNQDK